MSFVKRAGIVLAALLAASVTNSANAQFVQEHIIAVESNTPATQPDTQSPAQMISRPLGPDFQGE